MSDTAALVAALADEDSHGTGERASARRLRAWARIGEPELRRAGTLRGLAQLGTVIWAAGLGWAAAMAVGFLCGATCREAAPNSCAGAHG
ncbi:hypothetical protein ACWC2H_38605 [Streptomyces sp. 900105755]